MGSTEGKALNAYQYIGCDDTLIVSGETARISRKVAGRILPQLAIREHEGKMFAAEMKADKR